MSAYFNSSSKYLNTTLTGTVPDVDSWKLVTCWFKWESGQSHNSANHPFMLRDASAGSSMIVFLDGSSVLRASANYLAVSANANVSGTFADDTWVFCACVAPPDDGTGGNITGYRDSTTATTSLVGGNTATQALDRLFIGNNDTAGDYSRMKGWVAELAVWKSASAATLNSIAVECQTKLPDAVGAGSPIWYSRLFSDATVATGASLTNNGTVTFDSGNHPSLSGGGGASIVPILNHMQRMRTR